MSQQTNSGDYIPFKHSIGYRLLRTFNNNKSRVALSVGQAQYSYSELLIRCSKLAGFLSQFNDTICAVLSAKSVTAYISIVSILFAGKSYLPLSLKETHRKNSDRINHTKTTLILADAASITMLSDMIQDISYPLWIIFPELESRPDNFLDHQHIRVICQNDLSYRYQPNEYSYRYAYTLFTSGSTGNAKCIQVSHDNLHAYLDNFIDYCKPESSDRFSQINDLSFDFSVHDIFVPLSIGACVCVISEYALMHMIKQLKQLEISYFSALPSIVSALALMQKSSHTSLPAVKHTMFCGEVLHDSVARAWSKIVPNSIIDNFYGPSESTVAITAYRWRVDNQREALPIGHPLNNCKIKLLDTSYQEVVAGDVGEIWISSLQLIDGYSGDQNGTQQCFRSFIDSTDGSLRQYYRSGDLAFFDSTLGFVFQGRCDDQFKIRGRRVEILELEQEVKKVLPYAQVAIIPINTRSIEHCCQWLTFIVDDDSVLAKIQSLLNINLPSYYLPVLVRCIRQLPLTVSGKINYPILKRSYDLWQILCQKNQLKREF